MLDRLIAVHRNLYADDTRIDRLVTTQPPVQLDPNTGIVRQIEAERYSGGMYLSGRLHRYLGHPEAMGQDFPWTKAKWLLRVECRRKHIAHRSAERPYWRGSLCHEAVSLTVCRGFSAENAALILKVDDLDSVLTRAFRFIEEQMDHQRERAEQRLKEDRGLFLLCKCRHDWSQHDRPSQRFSCGACRCDRYEAEKPSDVHKVTSEEHVKDCPNPECRRRRAVA